MSELPLQSKNDEQQSREILNHIRLDLVELNNEIARLALDIFEEIQPFAEFKWDNGWTPEVESYGYYSVPSKWLLARPFEPKAGGDEMPTGHLLARRLLLRYRFSKDRNSDQDRGSLKYRLRRSVENSNNLSDPDYISIETHPLGTGDWAIDAKYGGSKLSVRTLNGGGIPLLREAKSEFSDYTVTDENFRMFSALQPRFLTEYMIDYNETRMLDFRDKLNAFGQLLQDEELNPRTK